MKPFVNAIRLSHSQKILYSCVFFIAFSFLLFFNSLEGEFIGDDMVLIVNNTHIHHCSWQSIGTLFTRSFFDVTQDKKEAVISEEAGYYRPLVMVSYMLDYALWGTHPIGYHVTNILLHIISGMLLFFLIEALTKKIGLAFLEEWIM